MSSFAWLIIVSCFLLYAEANFTQISRNNVLLSRRKRYLAFPMGSNLVMTMSMVKAFLQVQPRGYNFLFEVDVPFALPSDPDFFKKNKGKKKHRMERRHVYSQLDTALTENGLNGTACVQRIICDTQQYIPQTGKSLVKDLLLAIFTYSENDINDVDAYYNRKCDRKSWSDCEVPFLNYLLKSFEMSNT